MSSTVEGYEYDLFNNILCNHFADLCVKQEEHWEQQASSCWFNRYDHCK
jgi:hypothetical protein